MTRDERLNFVGFLRNATDLQLYGIHEKETRANREAEIALTESEMSRRGLHVPS
jgi:hypothetical protein